MTIVNVDCMLNYSLEQDRLFMVCRTEKGGVVVSSETHEVVNHADNVIESLVLSALQEMEMFIPFMLVRSNVEVVDPATMRFVLDSKMEIDRVQYRKCNHCHQRLEGFIQMITK